MSRLLLRPSLIRALCPIQTTPTRLAPRHSSSSSSFQNSPSPPRLPAAQQAEFERLQRAAEAALSSHTTIPSASPENPLSTSRHVSTPSSSSSSPNAATATEAETVAAGSFSGGMRKGAPPEFAGDKNPRTGEVGGPKNEPLRWGGEGDWSFNGRVTDF